ncbi:MAG: hypothetical protein FDX18_10590 [Chlorobium sp.]|nr:MAG: hypothetical protein FDX18_10590 [Chlorobium sp.]
MIEADHPASPHTRKCSAEYSPALAHLNPTTRATNKPLNSARQSLHSLHFVTLSWSSVGKRCSAEKNPHRRCSSLRSVCATYRMPNPTDPSLHVASLTHYNPPDLYSDIVYLPIIAEPQGREIPPRSTHKTAVPSR